MSTAPWIFGNEKSRHKGVKIESGTLIPWKQAAKIAELDWKVELRDPQSADLDAIPADEWKQVVKVTHEAVTLSKKYRTLSMVGLRYTTLQNEDAFGWFDKVLMEGAAAIRAAGHRDHGKQVWMIAERPMSVELYPGVEVKEKLILETSHDGSTALRVRFAPHVHSTGVPVAIDLGKKIVSEVRVRHTKSIGVKLDSIDKILDKEGIFFEAWRSAILGDNEKPGFIQKVVTESDMKKLVEKLFPAGKKKVEKDGKTEEIEEVSGRAEKARSLIQDRITEQQEARVKACMEAGKPTAEGVTALDAYLGVSSYVALDRRTRGEGNQWIAATFGSGADMRQRAFDLICGM
jgi:hypothetical protein